jgi:hypothetical protein
MHVLSCHSPRPRRGRARRGQKASARPGSNARWRPPSLSCGRGTRGSRPAAGCPWRVGGARHGWLPTVHHRRPGTASEPAPDPLTDRSSPSNTGPTAQHSTIEAPKERGTVGGQLASGSHGILVLAAGRGPGRPRATSGHPAGWVRSRVYSAGAEQDCRTTAALRGHGTGGWLARPDGGSPRRIPAI